MRVLFHTEQLNFRGTTNSIFDYAKYNQEILGNESVIVFDETAPIGVDVGSNAGVITEIGKHFQILTYSSEDNLNKIAEKFDLCYTQRAGRIEDDLTKRKNPIVTSTRFGVHCVFQWYDPHGDVYAYISEWLANNVAKSYGVQLHPYVPYIVDLPEADKDFRKQYNFPKDRFIIGRIGGYNTFDLPHVKKAVQRVAETRDDILFIFANTEPFSDHKNILFVEPFFDQQLKANYIEMCDAMLHGRQLGETFGLSISEFLFKNKPVLAWNDGFDKNHIEMLKDFDLLYGNDEDEVYRRIVELRDRAPADYRSVVSGFSPRNVMEQFSRVFLTPPHTLTHP